MAVPSILKDNLSIPVIGSPLFIISNPDLVIAQCKAGVIGYSQHSMRDLNPCSKSGSIASRRAERSR